MPQPSTATVRPAGCERAPVSFSVDSSGHAAHDHDSGESDLSGQRHGAMCAVGRAAPGTDDRNCRLGQDFADPAHVYAEAAGRGVARAEAGRADRGAEWSSGPCGQLARRPIGEGFRDMLGKTISSPERAATVAATRATFARPRAESGRESTARSRSRTAARRKARLVPAPPLPPPPPSPPPRAPRGRRAPGSAPAERRRRGRSGQAAPARACRGTRRVAAGEHEHSAAGSPLAPQGQRFMVPTSRMCAGKTHCPGRGRSPRTRLPAAGEAPREQADENSPSSSRRRTP